MVEVQDIFRLYENDYRQAYNPSYAQCKAMSSIIKCRTAALGGHNDTCDNCGNVRVSYNSCRNRHCPKCQTLSKERWIDNQKYNLLNIGYFHAVFTVPDDLRPVFLQNQEVMYNLLFKAVAETLHELSANRKYLGAKIGFTSILHTWGQNLMFHPHIHCIIPSGGISSSNTWVNSREKFFIPVKVLSRKFRGKFLALLQSAKLECHGEQRYLDSPECFQSLLESCYGKEWVVYCKPPFKSASCVVEYLGRYTHRVAISNNRILKLENGFVSFKWRDYKDAGKWKLMTVSAVEFIRRFLTHILPPGFMKIRHYGFLGNANKSMLLLCKKLTNTLIQPKTITSTLELIGNILGRNPAACPVCGYIGSQSRCLSPPIAC